MTQSCRNMAFLLVVASSIIGLPAPAEKVVFRDGNSTEVSLPPCLDRGKVLLEIVGLPTPIAYDRNLIDEARTFHANPRTPLLRLFAPCPTTGPVAEGVTGSAPAPTPPAPVKAYSAPASSGSSSSSGQCAATTKKGTRCSRRAQPGRAYCYQH